MCVVVCGVCVCVWGGGGGGGGTSIDMFGGILFPHGILRYWYFVILGAPIGGGGGGGGGRGYLKQTFRKIHKVITRDYRSVFYHTYGYGSCTLVTINQISCYL